MTETKPTLDTLILTTPKLSAESMAKLESTFKTIHRFDSKDAVTPGALKEADAWFSSYDGVNEGLKPGQVGKLRIVQLSSAGANNALTNAFWKEKQAQQQVALCTASGIHAYTIPQYVIAQIINLYMNVHNETFLCRSEKKWPERSRIAWDPQNTGSGAVAYPTVRGKTAGMLGYGAIGREAARLLKAMGCNIIAANSSGQKKTDEGVSLSPTTGLMWAKTGSGPTEQYIIAGTGDKEGDLPSEWYSTTDPKSFDEFFRKSDIVVASLPGTDATTYLVQSKHLDLMPLGGVFVNVGRGSLVRSSDLLASLAKTEQPGTPGLFAAALDVTDPEPLTEGHELFSHPRVIITPHTSGVYAGYFDAATELLVANVERLRNGDKPYNVVNFDKGY